MNRRIVGTQLHAQGLDKGIDTYFDRVVKYIPVEIVSAWVAAKGLVQAADVAAKDTVMWICFAVGSVFTILTILKQTGQPGKPHAWGQIAISTLAFVIWTVALGEPFTSLLGTNQQALYGSLLLIFFTLGAGFIVPKES